MCAQELLMRYLNPTFNPFLKTNYIELILQQKYLFFIQLIFLLIFGIFFRLKNLWGSKIWARNLGPGTTFHQQYVQGEEITEDRCN